MIAFSPPFNIDLDDPGYQDRRPEEHLQAEVAVMLKRLGFVWRNTAVWHYAFGPCQRKKLTPSWVALHYFVRDARWFTFNVDAVRVPSQRQLTYADRRATPGGKTPDDVWLLRLQEAEADQVLRVLRGRLFNACDLPKSQASRHRKWRRSM
jgi:hypothetical protein